MVHCLTASRFCQPEVVLVGDLTGAQGSWERAWAGADPSGKKNCCMLHMQNWDDRFHQKIQESHFESP